MRCTILIFVSNSNGPLLILRQWTSARKVFFDAADRVPYVTADVSGDTAAGEALYEAHRRLCAEGLEIERAVPNLVAVSSMAHRFGVSRQAAQRWSKAETFPLPIITDGTSL